MIKYCTVVCVLVHIVKVKQSRYRPGLVPEGSRKLRFPHFMTTTQEGGKVVSLTHRPPLPPGNSPGTHFCWRLSRPQGHSAIGRIMSMKNSNSLVKQNQLKLYAPLPKAFV